jgi:hypothetical protein
MTTTTAIRDIKIGLGIKAYGMELRLWREQAPREWRATLQEENTILHCHFEEDNLMMAKLHVLGEARNRALSRADNTELPGCDTFFDSWKPIKLTQA